MTITGFQLRKRVRAALSNNTQSQLLQLKKEAISTYKDLSYCGYGTPLTQLVTFYQLVSPWWDKRGDLQQLEQELSRIDYGQYRRARQALTNLTREKVRNMNGINRTLSGEKPSSDNIFLGYPPKTITYWHSYLKKDGSRIKSISKIIDAWASIILTNECYEWRKMLNDLIYSIK